MFTFEIYPTIVRTTGMGLCSMVARIGAIAAPEVNVPIDKNLNSSRIIKLLFIISEFQIDIIQIFSSRSLYICPKLHLRSYP